MITVLTRVYLCGTMGTDRGYTHSPHGRGPSSTPSPPKGGAGLNLENWTEYHHRAEPPSSGAGKVALSLSIGVRSRSIAEDCRTGEETPAQERKGAEGARVAPSLGPVMLSRHLEKSTRSRARHRRRGGKAVPLNGRPRQTGRYSRLAPSATHDSTARGCPP